MRLNPLRTNMSKPDCEENSSDRQQAEESLLSGGERVSKGRQRSDRDE
jgi:hypothetical protein